MQCWSSRLAASRDLLSNCYNNAVDEAPQQCVQPHGKMSCMSAPGRANREKTMPSKACLPNANQTNIAQLHSCRGAAQLLTCLLTLALSLGRRGDERCPAVAIQMESFQQLHPLRAEIHLFNLLYFGISLSRLLRLIGIDQKK